MTTYSGLVLIDRYVRLLRLHHRIRRKLRGFRFKGDYSVWNLLVLVVLMLMVGGSASAT
jgi:hypothetical protein